MWYLLCDSLLSVPSSSRFKSPQYKWGCLGVSWCIYFVLATTAFLGRSIVPVCVLFLPVLVIDTFCCLSVLKTLQKPPPRDIEMVEKEKKKKKEKGEEKRMCSGVMSPGERKEKGAKKVERGGKGEMNSMKRPSPPLPSSSLSSHSTTSPTSSPCLWRDEFQLKQCCVSTWPSRWPLLLPAATCSLCYICTD